MIEWTFLTTVDGAATAGSTTAYSSGTGPGPGPNYNETYLSVHDGPAGFTSLTSQSFANGAVYGYTSDQTLATSDPRQTTSTFLGATYSYDGTSGSYITSSSISMISNTATSIAAQTSTALSASGSSSAVSLAAFSYTLPGTTSLAGGSIVLTTLSRSYENLATFTQSFATTTAGVTTVSGATLGGPLAAGTAFRPDSDEIFYLAGGSGLSWLGDLASSGDVYSVLPTILTQTYEALNIMTTLSGNLVTTEAYTTSSLSEQFGTAAVYFSSNGSIVSSLANTSSQVSCAVSYLVGSRITGVSPFGGFPLYGTFTLPLTSTKGILGSYDTGISASFAYTISGQSTDTVTSGYSALGVALGLTRGNYTFVPLEALSGVASSEQTVISYFDGDHSYTFSSIDTFYNYTEGQSSGRSVTFRLTQQEAALGALLLPGVPAAFIPVPDVGFRLDASSPLASQIGLGANFPLATDEGSFVEAVSAQTVPVRYPGTRSWVDGSSIRHTASWLSWTLSVTNESSGTALRLGSTVTTFSTGTSSFQWTSSPQSRLPLFMSTQASIVRIGAAGQGDDVSGQNTVVLPPGGYVFSDGEQLVGMATTALRQGGAVRARPAVSVGDVGLPLIVCVPSEWNQ